MLVVEGMFHLLIYTKSSYTVFHIAGTGLKERRKLFFKLATWKRCMAPLYEMCIKHLHVNMCKKYYYLKRFLLYLQVDIQYIKQMCTIFLHDIVSGKDKSNSLHYHIFAPADKNNMCTVIIV